MTHRIKKWPDPLEYAGQPRCVCCGTDAAGVRWPLCADIIRPGIECPPSLFRLIHDATCRRYWSLEPGEKWMCERCASIFGDDD